MGVAHEGDKMVPPLEILLRHLDIVDVAKPARLGNLSVDKEDLACLDC